MLHEYGFVLLLFSQKYELIIQKNTLRAKQTGSDVQTQGKGTHAPKSLNYQLDINKDGGQAQAEVKHTNFHTFIHSQHTKLETKNGLLWGYASACALFVDFYCIKINNDYETTNHMNNHPKESQETKTILTISTGQLNGE